MKKDKFSVKSRINSFGYAFNGLKILLKTEHNARIHLIMTVAVIVLGFFLHISSLEWIFVFFAVGFVFVSEIINTSIEYIANYVSPDYHDQIKKVKDLSAAAVFVAALSAFVAGLIIFIPKLLAI